MALLDTNLKIILLDQNNYTERSNC